MKKKQKKRIFGIVLIVSGLISLAFVPWVLVRAWIAPLPDTVQQQAEKGVTLGFDGIIVYVDRAGKPPEFYAAGWHDRVKKIPANPHALFKIASISKLYLAVVVAKLTNAKRLSLDRTLADYLPELSGRIENADRITLRMMVGHRSGIPNYTDIAGYWDNPPQENRKKLELILDKPADFEPGKEYSYCNTNYLLIGEIVDKTLGYSHHQYIRKEILEPLQLKNTYCLFSEADPDQVMSGYAVGYDGDLKLNDFTSPSGSMVATAEDVGVFLRALNDGSLLSDSEQAIYSSIYEYEHTGLLPGYSSIARYHKDMDAVIVLFVNTNGGYTWNLAEIIYNRIVKIVRKN